MDFQKKSFCRSHSSQREEKLSDSTFISVHLVVLDLVINSFTDAGKAVKPPYCWCMNLAMTLPLLWVNLAGDSKEARCDVTSLGCPCEWGDGCLAFEPEVEL